MKSRSHRLPMAEPRHDDWVDGSWTVDCVCGVNYDDGEEMVDCDECGVWVHTRCSRYVKSEKSFACDKCKTKTPAAAAGDGGSRNDSEETEVAEFLVELPAKTLRMDNPNPYPNPNPVTSRRPFRLWTDLPMEDRVHVQGVPGGEHGLFSGASVFGRELWKSTGYVPKKFNFRYNEFPLDNGTEEEKEEGLGKMSGEENGGQADNGAGVLFSMLRDNDVDNVGVKSAVEGSGCHEVVSLRQKKKLGGERLDFSCPEDGKKKEGGSAPNVLHSGKRKKEEIGMLKDQSVKKKVRTVEKEGDVKKRVASASKAVDGKHLESSQDRGAKLVNIQCGQNVIREKLSGGLGECATNLASNEHGLEVTLRNDVSSDILSRGGNREDHVTVGSEKFSKTNNGVDSIAKLNGFGSTPVKEEVPRDTLQTCGDVGGGTKNAETGSHDKKPVAVDVEIVCPDAKESRHGQSSDTDEANSRPNKKLKGELDSDDLLHHHVESLPLNDVNLETIKATTQYPDPSVKVLSEEGKVIETSVINSEANNPKGLDAARTQTVGSSRTDKSDESPDNACQSKRQPTGEGSTGTRKKSSGLKYNLEVVDELHKSNGTARSHSTASYQRKAASVVKSTSTSGVMKSTSTSGGNISKPSDNHTAATVQNPSLHSKNELSERSLPIVKDNASADMVEHEEKCERPKKLAKEYSRHHSKISESTKLPHTSDSKKPSSDLKGSSLHSSSKVPLVPNVTLNRVSGECASPPHMKNASNMQKPGKVEKLYQSGNLPSSKGTVTSMTAATSANVPSTLSDEELALLLHQELNSSPRVPRVPRMRHAGSLPQITGPSATSMLMKRTTSGGGKDHSVASRRRTKDFSGEGSYGSLEVDNEAKKMERKPSSPDNRRRDSGYSDSLSKREADGAAKSVHFMKKTNMGSSLSSSANANGHNLSSSRPSSRTASGDDSRTFSHITNRTLPGLIAEIMSEGRRMTYEELCNLVLPHWPHLRKHNGERYAYSSHSQAVLDCLRNRSEWARLVDRGPKTSTTRKRRKHDADSMSIESEDNEEENRVKNTKDSGSKSFESHHEDFPKGKRKARKRRRLALQGRAIVRRRRRADVVSDDESESFSTSSEEDSSSSEDEIQGGGTSIAGSEASASSYEV